MGKRKSIVKPQQGNNRIYQMKKCIAMLLTLPGTVLAWAQEMPVAEPVEMADMMRAEGKIYVVVAIVLMLFAGLVAYLVHIDRKISRLEKEV
jgi:hypothetical protein